MENAYFFIGFFIASIVGLCSSFILERTQSIETIAKQIFIFPPQPALRPIHGSPNKSVGANPTSSPVNVISIGCANIIGQLMAVAIVLAFLLWFLNYTVVQFSITEEFLVGALYAAIFGALLQQMYKNWKVIINLIKRITKPPEATLRSTSPPNAYHATAFPPEPACSVFLNCSVEILFRTVWFVILMVLLGLAIYSVHQYLVFE